VKKYLGEGGKGGIHTSFSIHKRKKERKAPKRKEKRK